MSEYIKRAIEKLDTEFKEKKVDQKGEVIIAPVKDALCVFCKQEEEFAQAVCESDKTLSDCCKAVLKDVKTAISDLEAYKRAVQFYFPGAGVSFEMKIDLCASVKDASTSHIRLSLMDLL